MNSPSLHSKLPKYVRVAEEMRNQIGSGVWRSGDKLPRVSEMQKQFGVSLDTLDKVLGLLETDGTITRTQGSGVYVADATRRRARTGAIGLYGVVASLTRTQHPYFAQLAQGALQEARRDGLEIVLLSSEPENVRWEKLDGVLVVGVETETLKRHALPTLPVVVLMDHQAGLSSVDADDYQGARLLTEHLLELGHRRIAFLHSYMGPSLQARLDGYRDALRAAGLEANPRWERPLMYPLPEGRFFSGGRQGMNDWLQDDWKKVRMHGSPVPER